MEKDKRFHHLVWPELVFGIAGPIGIKIDEVCESLAESLKFFGYTSHLIKITSEIAEVESTVAKPQSSSFYDHMKYKMDHANSLCKAADDPSFLMHYALKAIKRERAESEAPELPLLNVEPVFEPNKIFEKYNQAEEEGRGDALKYKAAYIIRQIKRPEEIAFLRTVYGDQFILISAYGSEEDRRPIIEEKLRASLPVSISEQEIRAQVDDLILRDMHEGEDEFGQHLRDSYYKADVFINGIDRAKIDQGISRLMHAYFGSAEIAPTKDEFALYMATAASFRSSDLSRQVGAAIVSSSGDLISQGCNEVPRAFGGTYWYGEDPDFRDVKIGYDPNDQKKQEVVRDLVERLDKAGLLSSKAKRLSRDIIGIVESLTDKVIDSSGKGALRDAVALDITEYGRVVHAEMNAILGATRLGHATGGSSLYCTTFPCHNCTKHIIASGIRRVVYLEPYPKSKAKELFKNEISIENDEEGKISFVPFIGIAPGLFQKVFQKGKRKKDGKALRWMSEAGACPVISVTLPAYVLFENAVTESLEQ